MVDRKRILKNKSVVQFFLNISVSFFSIKTSFSNYSVDDSILFCDFLHSFQHDQFLENKLVTEQKKLKFFFYFLTNSSLDYLTDDFINFYSIQLIDLKKKSVFFTLFQT